MIRTILQHDFILKRITKYKANLKKARTSRENFYTRIFSKKSILVDKNLHYIIYKGSDLGYKINVCEFIAPKSINNKNLSNIITETKNLDRRVKRSNFIMPYNSKLHKLCLQRKMQITGILLIANVADGLLKLSKYDNPDFRISLIKEEYIEEILSLEVLAHRRSLTSRVRNYSKPKARDFFKFLASNKLAYVAKNIDNKIVGVIGINDDSVECGYVMCIAVHPDFQGLGISKLLYKKMLNEFKFKKIKYYFGTTTTAEVLKFAKILKRKPIGITFVC